MSKIEWTEETWNPSTGCTKVSPGCKNCYAEVMARRLQSMESPAYVNGFKFTLNPLALSKPVLKKKPTTYFVDSMSDLFHPDAPEYFIDSVFDVIRKTERHTYQVLTKRSALMKEYFSKHACPKNCWLGVSVEDKAHGLPRIDDLRNIDAPVRFLSCEPLLEDLGKIDLTGINWVIVGGESGLKARPMRHEWVLNILYQTKQAGAAFFFKQWGTWGDDGMKRSKAKNGALLEGREWKEYPKEIHHEKNS